MRRVFVDTNVFLRFLTADDPGKAEKARRLFASAVSGELVVETSLLVIAEIVWTLESFYGLTHDEVAEQVTTILATPNLECPGKELLFEALLGYTERNVDFHRCLSCCLPRATPRRLLGNVRSQTFSAFPRSRPPRPLIVRTVSRLVTERAVSPHQSARCGSPRSLAGTRQETR
jgi:predicted nucleic-acid-binding protein